MNELICPIREAGSGNGYHCKEGHCAFWDEAKKQCCIKTFCLKPNNITVTIDRNPAMEGEW